MQDCQHTWERVGPRSVVYKCKHCGRVAEQFCDGLRIVPQSEMSTILLPREEKRT